MSESTAEPSVVSDRRTLDLVYEAWNKLGLPTVLVFVAVGMLVGWVPSPLAGINTTLGRHVANDGEIIRLLKQNCVAMRTLAKLDIEACLAEK